MPTGVSTFGLIINPAIFEQAGVELPDDETWTWDDFTRIATEISANTPEGVYGSTDPTTGPTSWTCTPTSTLVRACTPSTARSLWTPRSPSSGGR